MKVIIDISKDVYDRIHESPICDHVFDAIDACKSIKNGTPLPKGHGEYLTLADVPTIIEADKAESEEKE